MFTKVNIFSIKKSLFADLLVKTSHQRILAFFLARPSGQFYGTEIAKEMGISIAQVSKVLIDLRQAKLLEMERKGRTELYRVVSENPVLRAFKVLNTIISIEPILERLRVVSRGVILYGSCASGMNIESNDLDLLVVCTKIEEVQEIISGFPSDAYYGFSELRAVVGCANLKLTR